MSDPEWRGCGIQMSRGWQHYDHHSPEAPVLLFRRVLGSDPMTGEMPAEMVKKVEEREAFIACMEQERQRVLLERSRRQELLVADMF
mmetsp:Transcript_35725/g.76159  ORF Transcript_35725/g.76159 Transcript_35725/m.76159 type:complete len:87 (-) Transcript_35725:86-346(-)